MGHTPRVLALALGLAAACADSGEQNASAKPHVANPLLRDGAKDAVQDLTYDEYKKYVKDDAKLYHVMALFNVVKDRQERECPSNCVWMDKQFDTLAEAYIQQRNGREVYEYDGRPVYFARVALPTRSDKVASEVGGIPSLFLSRAKSSKQTRYGHSNLLEDAKRIPDFEKMPAKLRAGKYSVLKYLKKADTRAERRRRGLATQEEREEAAYGISDYHSPHMTNLCKWLRLKTKHQIATCPQDVDRNIASTEKKSETGKNILVSIIGVSSLLSVIVHFLERVPTTTRGPDTVAVQRE
ncbi:hypothetical protein DIPPA_01739 [Diplonema papillatum]|nr:hypothetical protein DIPPA_01739 [Diplonema papillatum]